MTRTGDWEIRSVSGRLPDNPGELACMPLVAMFFIYKMSAKCNCAQDEKCLSLMLHFFNHFNCLYSSLRSVTSVTKHP